MGNMFLLALRFDVGDGATDAQQEDMFSVGSILLKALETMLLSMIIRSLVGLLLKLGRPPVVDAMHAHDHYMVALTHQEWRKSTRRGFSFRK